MEEESLGADTSFFAMKIRPNKHFIINIPEETCLRLNTVSVSNEDFNDQRVGKVKLLIKVNDGADVNLASFVKNVYESSTLHLLFGNNEKIEFMSEGIDVDIDITGQIEGESLIENIIVIDNITKDESIETLNYDTIE